MVIYRKLVCGTTRTCGMLALIRTARILIFLHTKQRLSSFFRLNVSWQLSHIKQEHEHTYPWLAGSGTKQEEQWGWKLADIYLFNYESLTHVFCCSAKILKILQFWLVISEWSDHSPLHASLTHSFLGSTKKSHFHGLGPTGALFFITACMRDEV